MTAEIRTVLIVVSFLRMDARAATSVRKQVLSGQVAADGSIKISNGIVDLTSDLSLNLVRKATEGQNTANGNVKMPSDFDDTAPLVRKATEISNLSMVRKAKEVEGMQGDTRDEPNVATDHEPAAFPSETKHEAENMIEEATLWAQYGNDNRRCAGGGDVKVQDQYDCQSKAIASGHSYYSYSSSPVACKTSSSCDPFTGTSRPWKIYHEVLWAQYGEGDRRCAGGGGVNVRNQYDCQSKAIASGHSYYSYSSSPVACKTSSSCDPLTGTSWPWKIYRDCSSYDESTCPDRFCFWHKSIYSDRQGVCDSKIPILQLAGDQSQSWSWAAMRRVPQLLTSSRKISEADGSSTWESCSGTQDCIGSDVMQLPNRTHPDEGFWGNLTDSVEAVATEFTVRCEGQSNAYVLLLDPCVQNTKLKVSYNYEEVDTSNWIQLQQNCLESCTKYCPGAAGCNDLSESDIQNENKMYADQLRCALRIPLKETDNHPTVRIEAIPSGQSAFTGRLQVIFPRAPTSFASCMVMKEEHGQCLDKLDGPNVSIRSSHAEQLDCLDGTSKNQRCEDWEKCLEPQTKKVLHNMLKGFETKADSFLDKSSSDYSSSSYCDDSGAINNRTSCYDPITGDVESFDCQCWDSIKTKSPSDIHSYVCAAPTVCCDWKDDHCPPRRSLLQNLHSTTNQLETRRGVGAMLEIDHNIGEENQQLDEAVSRKCR